MSDDNEKQSAPDSSEISGNTLLREIRPSSGRLSRFFTQLLNYRKWVLLATIAFVTTAGILWLFWWYMQYVHRVSPELLIPGSPELLLRVNIDPKSEQYSLLEMHLEKIPGYSIFKKALDPVGEGKTLSESLQDRLKAFDIDVSKDTETFFGDTVHVVFPSVQPIESDLRKTSLSFGDFDRFSRMFGLNRSGRLFASTSLSSAPEVLGDATSSDDSLSLENISLANPLDFIAMVPVRDTLRAMKLFRELKIVRSAFVDERRHRGIAYYRVDLQKNGEEPLPGDVSRFVRFGSLYHAIVGGNWVCASSEGDMQEVLDRQLDRNSLHSMLSFRRDRQPSSNDEHLRNIERELGSLNSGHVLVTAIFDVNSREFMDPSCGAEGCEQSSEYFRYPDRAIFGLAVAVSRDGINIKWAQHADGTERMMPPQGDGLASILPAKIEEKQVSVFLENTAFREWFYGLKRTRLTDKGRDQYEHMRSAFHTAVGIDIESDVIDHVTGSVALMLFSAGSSESETAIIAQVDSADSIHAVIGKVVGIVKTSLQENARDIRETASRLSCSDSYERSRADSAQYSDGACPPFSREPLDTQEQDAVLFASMADNAKIIPLSTPDGEIFSFSLSDEFSYSPASFSFAFSGNTVIFGQSIDVVRSILFDMRHGTDGKLSEDVVYKRALDGEFIGKGGVRFFAVPAGIFNSARSFLKSDSATIGVTDAASETNIDDVISAIGAFLKVFRAVGSVSTADHEFISSSTRILFDEIPHDEKDRAEKVLRDFISQFSTKDF